MRYYKVWMQKKNYQWVEIMSFWIEIIQKSKQLFSNNIICELKCSTCSIKLFAVLNKINVCFCFSEFRFSPWFYLSEFISKSKQEFEE
jgi:hypothetical protein